MTALEFQIKHRQALADFLASELGQALMSVLHDLRMQPKGSGNPSTDSYTLGGVAGYEQCEKTILSLSITPKTLASQAKQNYGVPDREPQGAQGAA